MFFCQKLFKNAHRWTHPIESRQCIIKYSTLLGHKWRSHRKLIAPTFHLNVLKSFIELFNDNSRHVCKKMRALDGKTFDCHDYMSECTVEILLGEFWQWNEFLSYKEKLKHTQSDDYVHFSLFCFSFHSAFCIWKRNVSLNLVRQHL